jgi:hypothetical protein
MYQSLNRRKILAVCVAASLISHVISLFFLQKNAFWDTPSPPPATVAIEKENVNILLKVTMSSRGKTQESGLKEQGPRQEIASAPPLALHIQPVEKPPYSSVPSMTNPSVEEDLLAIKCKTSFTLPRLESLNLSEQIPKDLIVPAALVRTTVSWSPSLLPTNPMPLLSLPAPQRASSPKIAYSEDLLATALHESAPVSQILAPQFSSLMPEFPSLEELGTASYSNYFDLELVCSPLGDGEGYVFALTLVPQPGLSLPKIRQHYSFLIDKANSIQKERLSAVKSAIMNAIKELDLEDSFNIIAFDNKIEKLSSAPLIASSTSLKAAKKFLDQVHLGSFFSSSNLSKPLSLTIPPTAQDDDIHTAILFTDGESLAKKGAQRELALEWTAYNGGRVSLYAIGVGGDAHLASLGATAAFNKGKIIYPPTNKGIKRKLLKLIKTVGHPIAKNLSATAIPWFSSANVALYPDASQMASLYLNEPYVILGTIDKLDNFVLFLQGKVRGKWLNIRKNISFADAKRGDGSLKAEWALAKAYGHYQKYLFDLNPTQLAKAESILEEHNLRVSFQ